MAVYMCVNRWDNGIAYHICSCTSGFTLQNWPILKQTGFRIDSVYIYQSSVITRVSIFRIIKTIYIVINSATDITYL